MTPRPLFALFAGLFCSLAMPVLCSADPAPATTRPTTQSSTADSHQGRRPQDGQHPGGPRRGNGYGRGPGPGMGGGFGGMNQRPQWQDNGPREDGQFMPNRPRMQNRDEDQRDDSDVDKKTIAKLEAHLENLSAKLDQMQKQLDNRDGSQQHHGRRQQDQQFSRSDDREGWNGYRGPSYKHGQRMQQRPTRQPGPKNQFNRQNRPAPYQYDRRGGGREYEQSRDQQFQPRRGGPRNWVQPYEQYDRREYHQSRGDDRHHSFAPMNGGRRWMRPPEGMRRFGPAFDGGGRQDGEPGGRWSSPRDQEQSNGFRGRQSMDQGQHPTWRAHDDQHDSDRNWNDNRDGRTAPDFAGPPRWRQQHRDDNDSDNGGDHQPR